MQFVEPWVSDKDISAGERWAQAIAGELASSNFGILCITPENLRSEWILFEAGALSKSMLDAKVIPLLFGLELSDLSGPLSQFQALKIDQQGLMDVVKAINAVSDNKAPEATIQQLVPALWPKLQQKLEEIPSNRPSDKQARSQKEILEELVSQVRGLSTHMREFDPEFGERDGRMNGRSWEIDFRMIDEMTYMMNAENNELSLLLLAGFIRGPYPWLAEILTEAHRELKDTTADEASIIMERVMRAVMQLTRGPMSESLFSRTKAGQRLMFELPRVVERALRIRNKTRRTRGIKRPLPDSDKQT